MREKNLKELRLFEEQYFKIYNKPFPINVNILCGSLYSLGVYNEELTKRFNAFVKILELNQAKHKREEKPTFQQASELLIKWLTANVHPHHTVIVTATGAELLEGKISHQTNEFLVD